MLHCDTAVLAISVFLPTVCDHITNIYEMIKMPSFVPRNEYSFDNCSICCQLSTTLHSLDDNSAHINTFTNYRPIFRLMSITLLCSVPATWVLHWIEGKCVPNPLSYVPKGRTVWFCALPSICTSTLRKTG